MATQVEISTVKARKEFEDLIAQTKKLVGQLKVLESRARIINKSMGQVGRQMQLIAKTNRDAATAVDKQARAEDRRIKTVNKARNAMLDLRAKIRLVGGSSKDIQKIEMAFRRYSAGVINAKGDTTRLRNATLDYDNVLRRVRRDLTATTARVRQLGRAQNRTAASGRRLARATKGNNVVLRNLGSSAIFAVGPLSGVGARINALGAISTRTGVAVALFAAGIAALLLGIFKLGAAMVRTQLVLDRIQASLLVATGSTEKANAEFAFLVRTVQELGLNFEKAGIQFSQLAAAAQGTTLAGKGVRDIFVAVGKASLALGLSSEQTEGALRAIQQIMSKGTVQAEELRGQLGERIPGAFKLAAEAVGVTTRELGKMLEQGQLLSTEFVPLLTEIFEEKFAVAAVQASDKLRGSMEKLKTEFSLFAIQLEEDIGLVETFADGINKLRNLLRLGRLIGGSDVVTNMFDIEEDLKEAEARLADFQKRVRASEGLKFEQLAGGVDEANLFTALLDVLRARDRLRRAIAEEAGPFPGRGTGPPAIPEDLRDFPIEKIDAIADRIKRLRTIIMQLSDTSLSFAMRTDLVDAFERTEKAAKSAAKIVKGLEIPEIEAAFVRFNIPEGTSKERTDALRKAVAARLVVELELKDVADARLKIVKDLNKAEANIENKIKIAEQALAVERDANLTAAEKITLIAQITLFEKELFKFTKAKIILNEKDAAALREKTDAMVAASEALKKLKDADRLQKRAETAKAAFESLITSAKRALEIQQDTNLTAREKITLIQEELLFERELFRQRKAGVPLTTDAELAALREKVDLLVELRQKVKDLKKEEKELGEFGKILEQGFKDLGSSMTSAIREGTGAFQALTNVLNNVLEQILNLIIQLTIINPLLNSIGGGSRQTGLGGIVSLITSLSGASGPGPGAGPPIRAAHGTRFKVGGVGGVDQNVIPLALTRGETVTVTPANQNAPTGQSVVIHFNFPEGTDTRGFAESEPQMMAVVANVVAAASASNN